MPARCRSRPPTPSSSPSPDEPNKLLAVNKISVTARAYRPPEIEIYNFEIQNIENAAEAANLTTDIMQNTVKGRLRVSIRLPVNGASGRRSSGDAGRGQCLQSDYDGKGVADLVIVTDKKVQPSDDALCFRSS